VLQGLLEQRKQELLDALTACTLQTVSPMGAHRGRLRVAVAQAEAAVATGRDALEVREAMGAITALQQAVTVTSAARSAVAFAVGHPLSSNPLSEHPRSEHEGEVAEGSEPGEIRGGAPLERGVPTVLFDGDGDVRLAIAVGALGRVALIEPNAAPSSS
jgi:hypothetical protein